MFYNFSGNPINVAYDFAGNPITESDYRYMGGYIEIQPDSWDGSTPTTGDVVEPTDSTAWGFPMSLSANAKDVIKSDVLKGDGTGIMYIRFPMGFAYRGSRNIDQDTGLAKNIGQRWDGQNTAIAEFLSDVVNAGGGLSCEWWCPAPYWLTSGAYYNPDVNAELWAGGLYPRATTLSSIKGTDRTQYDAQLDAFTDALLDDMEYIHTNVAPVRMYTIATEPTGSGKQKYGHCHWSRDVYTDAVLLLHEKVMRSDVLDSDIKMHICADDSGFAIGEDIFNKHKEIVWGHSHDVMRPVSGEKGTGADEIKNLSFPPRSWMTWDNVFICEYEYFGDTNMSFHTPAFRCANNMLRFIYEIVYRKARVLMPVIHICKPKGQTSFDTNTSGYCMYAVDMSSGETEVNPWSYNSWKFINDNLPIGSALIDGGDFGMDGVGYMMMEKDGNRILFLANNTEEQKMVNLNLDSDMHGKMYSASSIGVDFGMIGKGNAEITIPAYSGIVYS